MEDAAELCICVLFELSRVYEVHVANTVGDRASMLPVVAGRACIAVPAARQQQLSLEYMHKRPELIRVDARTR